MMRDIAKIIARIDIAHESQANTRWRRIALIAASALASAFALVVGSFHSSQTSRICSTMCSRVPLTWKVKIPLVSSAPLASAFSIATVRFLPGQRLAIRCGFSCNCLRSSDRQSGG